MTAPITCELWVNGARYADGQPGENPDDPFVLTGLTIQWGRESTVDQPSPATCSFTIADPPGGDVRFDATVSLGSTIGVWAAQAGVRVLVFGGRVTDLDTSWDDDVGAAVCDVIAADQLADLANRFVGAEPWPQEVLWQRAARIIAAVGLPASTLASIPLRPANLSVSRVDVDRQAAAPLLTDLATTGGAVLWTYYDPATNQPIIYYEDPALRASLYVFRQGTDLLWGPESGSGAGTRLSACEVLRDPVTWTRAVTDLITRAAVRWLDQSTSPGTTERTVSMVDVAAEATFGARGISIGTILTNEPDATALAAGTLAAHQPGPTWRTSGLTWDLASVEPTTDPDLPMTLLDNAARLGYAIALTELPYWTPTGAAVQLYIEGGTYSYETDDDGLSRWVLALNGSPATGLGGSLSYGQTDHSVRFVDIRRDVSYLDMLGVGPDLIGTGKTWAEIPGATTWASVPAANDWFDGPYT